MRIAKLAGFGLAIFSLICGGLAAAQVTVSDGQARSTRWAFCYVRTSFNRGLPIFYTPVFTRDAELQSQLISALWPLWEDGGTEATDSGYRTIYNAPDCNDFYDSRLEAETALAEAKNYFGSSREVGLNVIAARENERIEQARIVEFNRLVAAEAARLGEHRRAEAERVVRMRQASEAARQPAVCGLSANAPVVCR